MKLVLMINYYCTYKGNEHKYIYTCTITLILGIARRDRGFQSMVVGN
jgi:hypothetical protein